MSDYCVIVADGARARFFSLDTVEVPELESGPNLVEANDLINPEAETEGRALWSDIKTGRNRSSGGGGAHGYDDHRSQHEAEYLARFARVVAEQAAGLAGRDNIKYLVLVADKAMLGFLREALRAAGPKQAEIRELPKNLSKHATLDIHEHLGEAGLLPKRRRPGM